MKPAAMAASLVNLRNVSTHKVVALTLHLPAEQAQAIIDLFGWPTMVSPVSVAIARLNGGCQEPPSPQVERPDLTGVATGPQEDEAPGAPHPSKGRHWSDLTLAQQTGIIRNEHLFWEFAGVRDAEEAAGYIRNFCEIESCKSLRPGTEAAARWAQLQVRYGSFLRKRIHVA